MATAAPIPVPASVKPGVEVLASRCDAFKAAGNEAFKRGENDVAVQKYSKALALAKNLEEPLPGKLQTSRLASVLANRCAAYMALGEDKAAFCDAEAAARAAPDWPKAHFRLGTVHMRRKAYTQAYSAFKRGWHLDTSNKELTKACQQAHQAMVGLDQPVGSSTTADGGGGTGDKLMSQEELFSLREDHARAAYVAREEARRAARTTFCASTAAPAAAPLYREEALRRTAMMARGGASPPFSESGGGANSCAEAGRETAQSAATSNASEQSAEVEASPSSSASSDPAVAVDALAAVEEVEVVGQVGTNSSGGGGGDDDGSSSGSDGDGGEYDDESSLAPPPEYVLTRKAGGTAGTHGGDALQVKVFVPSVTSMAELDLSISHAEMRLEAHGMLPLEIEFPARVDDSAARAKFDKHARVLALTLPIGCLPAA